MSNPPESSPPDLVGVEGQTDRNGVTGATPGAAETPPAAPGEGRSARTEAEQMVDAAKRLGRALGLRTTIIPRWGELQLVADSEQAHSRSKHWSLPRA